MATPVPGNTVWLFTIEAYQYQQTILNTILLQREGSSSITDYAATAKLMLEYQTNNAAGLMIEWRLAQMSSLQYVRLSLQPISPNRMRRIDHPIADWTLAGTAGNLTGVSLPPNVAATITKYSVEASRKGIGSIHVGGQPAAEVVTGRWTSDQMVRLGNSKAVLLDGLGESALLDHNWKPILWNRGQPGVVRLVEDMTVQSTVRVERRRTVGQGI